MDKEMMKGSIDILVLSIISHHDSYSYEIIQKLKEQITALIQACRKRDFA